MTRRHVSLSKHDEHVLFTMLAIPVVIAKFPSTGYERQDEDFGRNDDVDVDGYHA